ncbi:MAG: M14 family zinc carboxypeptidase [Crocinitomicaceae bacterium]|nr:M14 family zinc carboxypeptidase [Crocinitomicaceae bacterium]
MKKTLTFLALLCASFSYAQQYSKVKIYTDSDGLQQLAQLGVPVDHGVQKRNTFFISDFSAQELEIIAGNGFMFEVLIDDVKAHYQQRNLNASYSEKNAVCDQSGGSSAFIPTVPANFETNPSSYAGFYTYQQMLNALDDMAAMYPNLITVKAPVSTFQTWEGRSIFHVKISDNPSVNEASEPKVLYSAIHHAREPMSMSQTIFYMWYLLENYATNAEVQYLVDNTEMYFVPCINADGYVHNEAQDPSGFGMHRKNKNPAVGVGSGNPGVDLNRNYAYGWNTTGVSSDESSDVFPGSSAFSEPETQAMQWLSENIGFTSAFNAHSYGNLLLHPIGTTNSEFADHHDYFTDLTVHMCSLNGYAPQKSSGLYPASGDSDDYMYKVDNGVGMKDTIFAMTPEVGSSFWPAATEVIPTCQGMVFPNLILSHMTHKYLTVNDTDPSTVATTTGDFNHDVQRLGREDGAITVSATPILNIQSVGPGVVYDIELRETSSGTISFILDPAIQFGDEIKYVLNTGYGLWTKHDTIVKTYGSLTLQFLDDASNMNNWTGPWGTTTSEFVSPSTSFTDSPNNYSNNTSEAFEYDQNIDLTDATDAMISFYAKWEIEADYDYCQFQVSVDGGSSWIGQCTNYTTAGTSANNSVQPDDEPVYEGFQGAWVFDEVNLSDYLGQVIKVRFLLESDGGVREDGFYFDDFTISFNEEVSNVGLLETTFIAKVVPNPANESVIISTSNVISNGFISLFDQSGKLAWSTAIHEQTNKIQIDTSKLSRGVYTIQIESGGVFAQPSKLVVIH